MTVLSALYWTYRPLNIDSATQTKVFTVSKKEKSYRIKPEKETLNSRRQKGERDAEYTMTSAKLFQIFGAATGNALLPTVCK